MTNERNPKMSGKNMEKDMGEISVLVGIPAYNEEVSITEAVERSREYADAVLVVDDNSSDETATVARQAGAHVIKHDKHEGKSGAIRTIFEWADKMGVERVVTIDGDLAHDPDDIPAIVDALKNTNSDVVIGSRYLKDDYPKSIREKFLIFFINRTNISTIGGKPVTDAQSGFRGYNRRAIEFVNRDLEIPDSVGAEMDIIFQVYNEGYGISEVPIKIRYDSENRSTFSQFVIDRGLVIDIIQNYTIRTIQVLSAILAVILGIITFFVPTYDSIAGLLIIVFITITFITIISERQQVSREYLYWK